MIEASFNRTVVLQTPIFSIFGLKSVHRESSCLPPPGKAAFFGTPGPRLRENGPARARRSGGAGGNGVLPFLRRPSTTSFRTALKGKPKADIVRG